MKITDEQRAAWVKALRSGDYVQGQMYLKYIDEDRLKHCCLGVLLETLGFKSELCTSPHVNKGVQAFDGAHTLRLPLTFENPVGRFFDPLTYDIRSLADINDRGFLSFNDIANIVETCQFIGN